MIFGGVTSFLYFTTLLQHYDRNVKYALQSIMETQFKMIKPKGERNILKNQKKVSLSALKVLPKQYAAIESQKEKPRPGISQWLTPVLAMIWKKSKPRAFSDQTSQFPN